MGDAGGPRAGPSSSGLKLVLPSLSALRELNAKKKRNSPFVEDAGIKKTPRPVKLKPLREVLTSLITKIRKKDDYAFFLTPVDPEKVPGYADVVKRPMDFGTMSTKVAKGKYRSLEEFAADFHLVIANAKAFNPPGTIYHSEAERIESWASEHISKSAAHVIEYETDWNIDIEQDEELNAEAEEDGAAAGTSVGPDTPARRSQSVASSSVPPPNKRARIAAKKAEALADLLEPDGHLPGYKDGLSAFPPGSDWAELMVALKLKGKRYRTKKERMRMEKGGPPFAADGSLDYSEMEDPFTVLSVLAPDSPSRPQLMPLYPPNSEASQTSMPPPANILAPGEPPPLPPSLTHLPSSKTNRKAKYRHWTVTRVLSSRGKAKEKEEEETLPAWRTPRDLHATDFGALATLVSRLAKETQTKPADISIAFGTQERLFEAIRMTVEGKAAEAMRKDDRDDKNKPEQWSAERAKEAQDWLREVVYGGVDGLAYLRSVAEFIGPPERQMHSSSSALGVPLAHYVNETLVEDITEGRHRIVDAVAQHVSSSNAPFAARRVKPAPRPNTTFTGAQLALIKELSQQPLDLAALIHVPEELFAADRAWAAGGVSADDPFVLARSLDRAAELLARLGRAKDDAQPGEVVVKMEVDGEEDPLQTELRLNLIALVKRAPLDQIARMPPELVPAHLRGVVPTIGF